jgi:transposase-like protein
MVFQMSKKQMGSSFIEDNYIEEGPSQPTQLYQPPKRQSKYLNPTMSTQSTPTEKRKKNCQKQSPPKCQNAPWISHAMHRSLGRELGRKKRSSRPLPSMKP